MFGVKMFNIRSNYGSDDNTEFERTHLLKSSFRHNSTDIFKERHLCSLHSSYLLWDQYFCKHYIVSFLQTSGFKLH